MATTPVSGSSPGSSDGSDDTTAATNEAQMQAAMDSMMTQQTQFNIQNMQQESAMTRLNSLEGILKKAADDKPS